jgi:hypothetical protein
VRAAFGSRELLQGFLGVQSYCCSAHSLSTVLLPVTSWLNADNTSCSVGRSPCLPVCWQLGLNVCLLGVLVCKVVFVAVSSVQKPVKPYTALLVADTFCTQSLLAL